MKKWLLVLLSLLLLTTAAAQEEEMVIVLDEKITVNGVPIAADMSAPVYLDSQVEIHGDVPAELAGLVNRVVTIVDGGVYRITGQAEDVQLAVRAGEEDEVRLVLDDVDMSCRTSSAIAVFSAKDPRAAGQYGVTIELTEGSVNRVKGSHTVRVEENDVKLDGAICSLVSLGFEGKGQLTVEADNEGVEVKYGHMTINGGVMDIQSGDDPLNVSEDGVGVLTMNDGYVYSAVKNLIGGEGDGIDSNGWIIFNGGTAINLAHPGSMDGGIDSDRGSYINGGVIVGAGNMYDAIEKDSKQFFMMLEFAEATDDLVVVTDAAGSPVFAYDFPHDYTYIAFSTPVLQEGATYHVYLGGEIQGEQRNGLYTDVTAYTPGRQLQHGEGNAAQQGFLMPQDGWQAFNPMGSSQRGGDPAGNMMGMAFGDDRINLNEILKDADLNELLKDADLNKLLTGFSLTELLTEEQIRQYLGDADVTMMNPFQQRGQNFGGMGGGFGGPRGMQSSADTATADFVLTHETTGFTNVRAR